MSETREELRRRVDTLAAGWIADASPLNEERIAALVSDLVNTGEAAEKAGLIEVATAAADLIVTVRNAAAAQDLARLAAAVDSGFAQLERALADVATGPTAPEDDRPAFNVAQDPELFSQVTMEALEHLSSVETQLLTLERDPANSEAIHSAFRSFHTVKGLAGFLELTPVQELAHEVETLLDQARSGARRITPAIMDVILAAKDLLSRSFDVLSAAARGDQAGPMPDHRPLLLRVQKTISGEVPDEAPPQDAGPAAPEEGAAQPEEGAASAEQQAEGEKRSTSQQSVVKVDTAKLDYLVDMVGELVIAQSQVRHDPDLTALTNPRLQRNMAQLTRTTADLQRTALSMRMVPVGQLFRRMVRLVRDLSRKGNKTVQLEIVGEETELDRTIVEELADPLIHMVRNSLDHGIATPEERVAAGKPPAGKLRLSASHQAGHILIEVADDGRGINAQKVLAKARERGLVPEGSHPSEAEILNLIFEPGFSTADKITDISGRGVGMDVVRRQIQKLRGRVEIRSVWGEGTTFYLKLPLTLAIIDGLVIGVGRERYIVPLFAVCETFRPTSDMLSSVCGRGEMVLLRGNLLPMVRLYQRFGVEPKAENPCEAVCIVAENSGRRFCLMVDEFIGKQEVVLKSLGESLKNISGVAGGAILGDGRVDLVLDLDGLLEAQA